jgi:hypothetical protein
VLRRGADGVASGLVDVPRGARLRVAAGALRSPAVTSQLRLGRVRSDAGVAARQLQVQTAAGPADPRPADPDGPGAFPALPPLVPGGAPPLSGGGLLLPRRLAELPAPRLAFTGTSGDDVLVGTSGADQLSAAATIS